MRPIDADELKRMIAGTALKLNEELGESPDRDAAFATCLAMVTLAQTVETDEDGTIECDIMENAALICSILDADSEGRVWNGGIH